MDESASRNGVPRWALWTVLIALFVFLSSALTHVIATATDSGEAWESTVVLFVHSTDSPELYPTTASGAPDEDYTSLIHQTVVLAPVIPFLYHRYTIEELRESIEVAWDSETSLITITARDQSQWRTGQIAQRTAESFVDWYRGSSIERAELSLANAEHLIAELESRDSLTDAQGSWLVQLRLLRVAWLVELGRLSAEDPVIIQEPAGEPVLLLGRHTRRNVTLAGVGSLVLGAGVAVFVETRRRNTMPPGPPGGAADEDLSFVEAMRARMADRDREWAD